MKSNLLTTAVFAWVRGVREQSNAEIRQSESAKIKAEKSEQPSNLLTTFAILDAKLRGCECTMWNHERAHVMSELIKWMACAHRQTSPG